MPSASVFLLLLCNDREVLGPWVNRRWLNWVAALIVGTLLLLSGILMTTTLFPDLNVVAVIGYLALGLVILAAAAGLALRWLARRQPAHRPHNSGTRGRPQHLADATADPATAGHLVTWYPTRHDRPARLPDRRRAAAGGQSRPGQPRITLRDCGNGLRLSPL